MGIENNLYELKHSVDLSLLTNGFHIQTEFIVVIELLGNAYEQWLGSHVVQQGGVDKLLHQSRKMTDRIMINVGQGNNSYELSLMESDGRLIVERERLGYFQSAFDISSYREETVLKAYNGMKRGDYI